MAGEIAAYSPGDRLYDGFVRQGFIPGQPVIYMFNPRASSVDDLKEAQYGSTRINRKCLSFEMGGATLAITVETVTARYVEDDEADHPDWYFEGRVIESGFNPIPAGSRARLYLVSLYGHDLEDGYVQLIADPDPDPNAAFRYTEEP
ncbi:hypothetical protein ACGFY9_39950 [Streptomyces sp. NPDC048504]|uniref:hypothetical protein n=1 Tax=Streptomyces sp. NPDC048504 TaxID=3365559 RepID=UPI0037194E2B